ncbi:MAG: PASTA domain-containing protein [Cyclobacteriaceae bacterium]|nr:PASTA domain-containing protein [Cyclobacteriaceae bacterium]
MNLKTFFKANTLGGLLANVVMAFSLMAVIAIIYFYIYLPNVTNHGKSIPVPDLTGMTMEEAEKLLAEKTLRIAVNDSAYLENADPLSILKQFPQTGEEVKENRTIYVSINRTTPTTLPVPDLVDRSLINAEVVLKSNELRIGNIYYEASPFRNLVIAMRHKDHVILAGTRINKGAIIDLIVGDGNSPADLVVGNLIGDTYKTALLKLSGWNLHLGTVEIPEGQDTIGIVPFVYKQIPSPGDSVRIGEPIRLWIAPKGYKEPL